MSEQLKTILSLEANEALDFFMKSEQYHGFELPEYFTFDINRYNMYEDSVVF